MMEKPIMAKFTIDAMQKILMQHQIEMSYYVDRLHVYVDSSISYDTLQIIKNWNKNNAVMYRSLPHYPQYNKKIELYQPSQKNLIDLMNMLECDYLINKVELALDYRTNNQKKLTKLRDFFDKHYVIVSNRKFSKRTKFEDTSYYHTSKNKTFVIYIDSLNRKHDLKMSLHTEYRLTGTDAVQKNGIYLIKSLVEFDHANFWSKHMNLYKPSFEKLGKSRKSYQDYTRQWYIKLGKKIWSELNVLQNFLFFRSHNHRYQSAFLKITTIEAFEKFLNESLRQKSKKCAL